MSVAEVPPAGPIKALSLWQPWASLVVLLVKWIETRSWATSYRGPLVIHSTASLPPLAMDACDLPPVGGGPNLIRAALVAGGFRAPSRNGTRRNDLGTLPYGAALATCTLVDCVPILGAGERLPNAWMPHVAPTSPTSAEPHGRLWHWQGPSEQESASTGRPTWRHADVEDQRPYGDFTPGRFAWVLSDVKPFREPQPIRGRQGLWGGRDLDLAVDVGQHGYANICRYCFAPLLHSEGWWCSDAHKAAFGRPVLGSGTDVVDEFRVDGPVTDGEQMELA